MNQMVPAKTFSALVSNGSMGLCSSLVDDTPLRLPPAIVDLSPSRRCVLEREYYTGRIGFQMGYAHNSFGELVQRAGLLLNRSAVASSHFLFATTTPGGIRKTVFGLGDCHHHHSSRQLKKITIIAMTQEGLASALIPIPAVTKVPVVDVISGTICC